MATAKEVAASPDHITQEPEWETPARYGPVASSPGASPFRRLRTKAAALLDRRMPSHRTYCGLRRRTLLIVAAVVLVALLALIIGLAAGLSARASQ
jgi:hypothetical protein